MGGGNRRAGSLMRLRAAARLPPEKTSFHCAAGNVGVYFASPLFFLVSVASLRSYFTQHAHVNQHICFLTHLAYVCMPYAHIANIRVPPPPRSASTGSPTPSATTASRPVCVCVCVCARARARCVCVCLKSAHVRLSPSPSPSLLSKLARSLSS